MITIDFLLIKISEAIEQIKALLKLRVNKIVDNLWLPVSFSTLPRGIMLPVSIRSVDSLLTFVL
jgi:hypothetical protein